MSDPDSTKNEAILRRAERAQAILQDPLVIQAFAQLEQDCITRWRHSRPEERDGREMIYQSLCLIEQLRQDFTSMVVSGRMTRAESEQKPNA